ncbi:UNKNOWN [Stylonychia lemnae]|uniref:Uncharacterized protein n=1 Tax=Stylonychia lemnae TaxID=5949 RepID=A0A078AJL6_STYLE|nr:UNKNOWN [Stylonychia lemnae]|eukprot:CDW81667.1 UNKNOWN [Stylonychia lemnae]
MNGQVNFQFNPQCIQYAQLCRQECQLASYNMEYNCRVNATLSCSCAHYPPQTTTTTRRQGNTTQVILDGFRNLGTNLPVKPARTAAPIPLKRILEAPLTSQIADSI